MKKFLAILLALMMVLSLVACGEADKDDNKGNDDGGDVAGVDMSKYPADLNSWTGQNFVDYFTEVGVFVEGPGLETWIQNHADYWSDTPVSECTGYWNPDDGSAFIMIFSFDGSLPDTTPEAASEVIDYIKANKALPEDYMAMPIDHLVGNVAFCYMLSVDENVYNAMEEAYNGLVAALGVTPDF